jgi:hypothetical protein
VSRGFNCLLEESLTNLCSKAALEALTEGMSQELSDQWNIKARRVVIHRVT